MASEPVASIRGRFWPRPRFSLRAFLLTFTAFAIGFPMWYRWPYEEVESRGKTNSSLEAVVTTWQRQWGGMRQKHGEERLTIDGVAYETTTYRNGHKHGPYRRYFLIANTANGIVYRGELCHVGQFFDDKPDGVWIETINDKKTTNTYRKGVKVTSAKANRGS